MKYPECLGRWINLMPQHARNESWFKALPARIQQRFWLIIGSFPKVVAAEYLRDNTRQFASNSASKSDYCVRGVIYSDRITFHFPDGDHSARLRYSPAEYQFVGYVQGEELRYVRCSNDRRRLESKLIKLRLDLINGGGDASKIGEPQTFPLSLEVAEIVGAVA